MSQFAIDDAQRVLDEALAGLDLVHINVDVPIGEVAVIDPVTHEQVGLGKYLADMEARIIQHIHGEKWSQQVKAETT